MAANRRGRRDNGLDASSFVPLRDVDPRVGEHLLDLLRDAGIAAYLEPTSDVDSYTRAISLPSPPSDRLWVDRAARPDAHALVLEHAEADSPEGASSPISTAAATRRPGRPEADRSRDEEIWAQIVADYDRVSQSPVPPWPVHEDVERVRADAGQGAASDTERNTDWDTGPDDDLPADLSTEVLADAVEEGDTPATIPQAPDTSPWRRTRRERAAESHSDNAADDPDDHYQPPAPPPVPKLQRGTLYALMLIAFGATMLVAPGTLDLGADTSFILGVLGIVSGVGMLVYRMRERPPFDEGPDDGAVV